MREWPYGWRKRRRYNKLSPLEQAAERRAYNAERIAAALDLERSGFCYFCKGRGRFRMFYVEENVDCDCDVCGTTGGAFSLTELTLLSEHPPSVDPYLLWNRRDGLKKAAAQIGNR